MQDWTAATRHGVRRKKKVKAYRKTVKKENTITKYLLILDLNPLRS